MATFTTETSSKPAFLSLLRSTEAPIALEPMPASQAKTILRTGSVRDWASSSSTLVSMDETELSLPFRASICLVAAARSPSSSLLRLARRITEATRNDVAAARRTDRVTPTRLLPGVWAYTAMMEPGAAGARRPAPKITRVRMPTMPPAIVASRVMGILTLVIFGAEDGVGDQQPGARPRVGLQQEQDRLALLGGLLDAERGQDAVVDGVVQEQHLGGLDDETGQREQAVVDQPVDAVAQCRRDGIDRRPEDEEPSDGQRRRQDAGGEVVDQHLEAGLDLAFPQLVDVLHGPSGQRPHDQGAEEVRIRGADDHAHGGHRRNHAAADAVDHPAALDGDEQRQHEPDHRADKADVGIAVGVVPEATDPADRGPARLNEERGDEAPGDEGGDVRHDHAGQEGAELLDGDPRVAGPAGASSCLGVHGHLLPPGRAPERGVIRATRSVATVACRGYRTVCLRTRSSGSVDRSTSDREGAQA